MVESYPEAVEDRKVSASFLHNGTVAMFEQQGFAADAPDRQVPVGGPQERRLTGERRRRGRQMYIPPFTPMICPVM